MHRVLALVLAGLLVAGALPAQTKADAAAAFQAQEWEKAAAAYKKVVEKDDKDSQAWHRLGFSLHALGKLDEALKAHVKCASFSDNIAPIGAYNAACVHALKGETEKAFAWLHKAKSKGFNNQNQLDIDTDMDNLRDDPRFKEFYKSLGASAAKAPVNAFVGTATRTESRVFFWNGTSSPGQMVLNYGPVAWKDTYAKQVESPKFLNRRWRLGSNSWTSYEANIGIKMGGQKIPAGRYYLTLEKKEDGFFLAFNDPAKIRAKKIDAFQANQTKGGIEVQLSHKESESDSVAKKLEISFSKDPADAARGKLRIHFGPHTLTGKYVTELAKKAADH